MDQEHARHKGILQGQGPHSTALLSHGFGSVAEESRVEITEGKREPQGCPCAHLSHPLALSLARAPHKKARRDLVKKSREWVLEKKERRRRQGKEVRPDTQYTGRKRKPRF